MMKDIFFFKYICTNRNIDFRSIDIPTEHLHNLRFGSTHRKRCRKQYRFLRSRRALATTRHATHWRSHLSKKRKSFAIYRAAVTAATHGLVIPFLPRRELIFRGDEPLHRGRRSFDRLKRCARSFNGAYFSDRAIARIFTQSRFSHGNFRRGK